MVRDAAQIKAEEKKETALCKPQAPGDPRSKSLWQTVAEQNMGKPQLSRDIRNP